MIDRREVLRYLGYGSHIADEQVAMLIDQCEEALEAVARPHHVYRIFPVYVHDELVDIQGLHIQSKNLAKNLRECQRIVLFAATLGAQVDQLIAKKSRLAMSEAVVLQAAATAMIEDYCDACQQAIEEEVKKEGLFLRPRFSPGYGDFSIEHQRDFMNVLDCPRKIGLTMTDKFLLAPTKSVTAVIGLSSTPTGCHKSGCEACGKKDCSFRRS